MQNLGWLTVAIVMGLAAGMLLGAQPSINGKLSQNTTHPLQASLVSFASGTALITLLMLISGAFPFRFTQPPGQLPWWTWTGGAIGVVVVTSSLLLVPRVGALPWFAALITGQTIAAILLDHFGWLETPQVRLSPLRCLAAVLLIAGVLTIVYAKHQDRPDGVRDTAQRHPEP
ncbi:MAG: DMT family transporter [Planctomycetota bacterium]